ncbi:hypothetical protein HMPREF0045_01313 [Actinomyces graevenitzii C83]|jgi:hypothetical protein|uniref:Uncharacterized protein n=1 Tax=Actinomyces graevenitzii C83 TaxID=435830 RepID=G9PGE7_9ACTO|nr:hypothetical protein HMPREF0045_01313 [Actinomyces graevenitzii C83]
MMSVDTNVLPHKLVDVDYVRPEDGNDELIKEG